LRGFGAPGGRNLPIPITLAIGFYNSLHYRASRDTTWQGNPSTQMWFFVQLCSSCDKIWTDLTARAVPLRQLSYLFY